jgi:hypothetical protein
VTGASVPGPAKRILARDGTGRHSQGGGIWLKCSVHTMNKLEMGYGCAYSGSPGTVTSESQVWPSGAQSGVLQ